MEKDCEIIKFDSREDYKIYLKQKINTLNEKGPFNIFMHSISNYGSKWFEYEIEFKKAQILVNGLTHIHKYGSIFGTMRYMGSTDDLEIEKIIDKIIDYNYDNLDEVNNVIIAMPKYVEVEIDGNKKQIEYSTYNGKAGFSELRDDKELCEAFQKVDHNNLPDGDHFKSCMYDAIKETSSLPVEYIVGVEKIIKKEKHFSFVTNHTHLSEIDEEDVKKHNSIIEEKIKNLYKKYGTEDPKELFAKTSADFLTENVYKSYDYDFDFD